MVLEDNSRIGGNDFERGSKDYPASLKEYYMKKYPDEKDYHVYSMTDKDGMTSYYVGSEHRGMRYYFDKTGNFLKEEKNKVKSEVKEHTDHD